LATIDAPTPALLSPFGPVGRAALGGLTYLGRLGVLAASALRSVFLPGRWEDAPGWAGEARWVLAAGLPMSAIVHVGIGSFLSMQAYYGGTFVDGTGAVVGVGLFRNVAPLLVGFVTAGLFAARLTPRFLNLARPAPQAPREGFLSRTAAGKGAEPASEPRPPALAPRAGAVLAAAVVCGPVLALWASAVGTLVGWRVSNTLLGVSTASFFQMFLDMIWVRDLVGVVVKGSGYAFVGALLAIHEGVLAAERRGDPQDLAPAAALRAFCLAGVTILFLNSSWFVLFYVAGPAFGPTLLTPPTA